MRKEGNLGMEGWMGQERSDEAERMGWRERERRRQRRVRGALVCFRKSGTARVLPVCTEALGAFFMVHC